MHRGFTRSSRQQGSRAGRSELLASCLRMGIVSCHRRRHVVTTVHEPTVPAVPDRLDRQFVASAPNAKCTVDITYDPTWTGFLSPAVVLNIFSRRSVRWAMADHLRTELVLSARDMARGTQCPDRGVLPVLPPTIPAAVPM